MELFDALGLDLKILLAQLVNFAVLLFVLQHFAYKPIIKMLDERAGKIEKGLKDAENAKTKLTEIEEKEKQVLSEAKKEAQKIIALAEDVAKKNKDEIVIKAQEQANQIIAVAEKKITQEKDALRVELKKEMASLVSLAVEKIVKEKVDTDKDRQIIKEVLNS